jgi:hypothetical protein
MSVINCEFYNNIITDILDRKILELLKIIHSNYPNKFTKKHIKLEYEFIKNRIKYCDNNKPISNSNKTYIITKKNKMDMNKIDMKTLKNCNKEKKKQISNVDRCCARIWNNIFDKNTLVEISDIDPKYKVKDFEDIKIKAFNNQYIIGSQCKRIKSAGSKYCFQHKEHLPHGDYFSIPSKEICFHYLKECNFI